MLSEANVNFDLSRREYRCLHFSGVVKGVIRVNSHFLEGLRLKTHFYQNLCKCKQYLQIKQIIYI
jgi:hypothetical protein